MTFFLRPLLLLLLLPTMVMSIGSSNNLRNDFIRAMNQATHDREQEQRKNGRPNLQQRLRQHAIPFNNDNRFLADQYDDAFDLNITEYALKYVGCQNIKSFSDDLAEDEDATTVFGLQKFVVFRLCEADKCSTYNKYGCMDNFGEYLLELELYLQIMEQYHYDVYLQYCETCIDCMTPDDVDDDLYYLNMTDDAAYDYNASNYTNDDDNAWSAEQDCEYFSACKQYAQACNQGYATAGYGVAYEDYFECQEFDAGDQVMYLGPHCASDGMTIQIGIFYDDECTVYAGDEVDMNSFTGVAFQDDGLDFYHNPTCVSCVNKEEYGLYNDDASGKDTYELCEMLYDSSGKCNRYLSVSDIGDTYQSSQQEDNELKVCNFIESLMENNYDEYGEINAEAGGGDFDFNHWKDPEEYVKIYRQVTPIQIWGLLTSIVMVFFLAIYAIYLYAKVRRINNPNSGRGRYPTYPVGERQASGVMMMRSGSTFA